MRWCSRSSLISTSFRSVPRSPASTVTLLLRSTGPAWPREPNLAVPAEPAHATGEVDPPLSAPSCHQRVELLHVAGGQGAGRAPGRHRGVAEEPGPERGRQVRPAGGP